MKYLNDEELENKFQEVLNYIKQIENEDLRSIVDKVFLDKKQDILNRAASPDHFEAGKYVSGGHHFFRGGLLCHLLGAAKISLAVAETCSQKINKDLILSGALLHDIGKTLTYDEWNDNKLLKNPTNDYARKFQHSYLGMQIVSSYLKENTKISQEIKDELLHIIASHMSGSNKTTTDGALVPPKTIEANIVSRSEHLDCCLSNFE